MIIECVNCGKKFNVSSELIPPEGRTIQCGSCNHVWFFNYNQDYNFLKKTKTDEKKEKIQEINLTKKNDIRSKRQEILVAPDKNLFLIVIQDQVPEQDQ